jgi:hypothetical protein
MQPPRLFPRLVTIRHEPVNPDFGNTNPPWTYPSHSMAVTCFVHGYRRIDTIKATWDDSNKLWRRVNGEVVKILAWVE